MRFAPNATYKIVEDISTLDDVIPQTYEPILAIPYYCEEDCDYCNGTGFVQDDSNTSGRKTCSMCNGTGKKRKYI